MKVKPKTTIFFAALIMGFFGICIGAPVRSMLGADGAETVTAEDWTPTAADYIQDGLVAMYDGIENSGYGVHDDTASQWIDLCGNYSAIAISKNASTYWGASYLHRDADSGMIATPIPLDNDMTLEIVMWASPETTTNSRIIGMTTGQRFEIDIRSNNPLYAPAVYYLRRASSFQTQYAYWQRDPFGFWCLCMMLGEDALRLKDEQSGKIAQFKPAVDIAYYQGAFLALGCWTNGYSPFAQMIGNYFAIRVYNRQLSSEEISYNHMIDRIRFNLP